MAKKAPVSEVRAWAREQGFELGDRGRLPAEVWQAWESRSTTSPVPPPRTAADAPAPATADELAALTASVARLEQQVGALTDRLTELERRPAAEPRRLFARAR
ncbi:MAG TPA: hypothetical protein VNU26_01320 [Mycobacteriales bacterium]|nr:hypothetical protein [Mycobacteriales bacterium]